MNVKAGPCAGKAQNKLDALTLEHWIAGEAVPYSHCACKIARRWGFGALIGKCRLFDLNNLSLLQILSVKRN